MPKLPVLTSKEIMRIFQNHGFLLDHVSGSHYVFYHPGNRKRVVVPYHASDLPKGTLLAILRQAGLSTEDI